LEGALSRQLEQWRVVLHHAHPKGNIGRLEDNGMSMSLTVVKYTSIDNNWKKIHLLSKDTSILLNLSRSPVEEDGFLRRVSNLGRNGK
jgi:hypothetical protein